MLERRPSQKQSASTRGLAHPNPVEAEPPREHPETAALGVRRDCDDMRPCPSPLPAPETLAAPKALPPRHVRFAVGDCLRDRPPREEGGDALIPILPSLIDRLPREDPEDVAEAYRRAILGLVDTLPDEGGRHGRLAERMRELHRPMLTRDRKGLTLADIAHGAGIHRETLAALMEHHGYLELVYFGGQQRRRLVTDQAFHAGLGHNVFPAHRRIGRLEGMQKVAPFPVFYPEHLEGLLWTLDFTGIRNHVADLARKADRLSWLRLKHPYLPVGELARLSGYSRRGIEKSLGRNSDGGPQDAYSPVYNSYANFCPPPLMIAPSI